VRARLFVWGRQPELNSYPAVYRHDLAGNLLARCTIHRPTYAPYWIGGFLQVEIDAEGAIYALLREWTNTLQFSLVRISGLESPGGLEPRPRSG
jgi:hypothetical protein